MTAIARAERKSAWEPVFLFFYMIFCLVAWPSKVIPKAKHQSDYMKGVSYVCSMTVLIWSSDLIPYGLDVLGQLSLETISKWLFNNYVDKMS